MDYVEKKNRAHFFPLGNTLITMESSATRPGHPQKPLETIDFAAFLFLHFFAQIFNFRVCKKYVICSLSRGYFRCAFFATARASARRATCFTILTRFLLNFYPILTQLLPDSYSIIARIFTSNRQIDTWFLPNSYLILYVNSYPILQPEWK